MRLAIVAAILASLAGLPAVAQSNEVELEGNFIDLAECLLIDIRDRWPSDTTIAVLDQRATGRMEVYASRPKIPVRKFVFSSDGNGNKTKLRLSDAFRLPKSAARDYQPTVTNCPR
jgi:hypothetical protein